MIEVRNLTKVFETTNYNIIAVSDANFDFEKGEVVVLLGRSGSGKSTLLNVLGGFDTTYAGSYKLEGQSVKDLSKHDLDDLRRKRVGFVFQDYVLLENLTIVENVELALNVMGVAANRSKRRAAMDALDLVGLVPHAFKYPYQLSGGQQQRVAIARAFVKNPDIIIADEPTAALDSKTSYEVMELLVKLCKNKLLIVATHNKSIVRDFGTRVIEMNSGYTIKDQLILSKNDVEVDSIDKLIDEDLGIVATEIDSHKVEIKARDTVQTTILEDLDLDVDDFKVTQKRNHEIDQNLKRKILEERRNENVVEKQRLRRFIRLEGDMVGKKKYALSSFKRNKLIHGFSIFLFVIFLLTISFTYNFTMEIYSGFNATSRYTRVMSNNVETIFFDETYTLGLTGLTDGDMYIGDTDIYNTSEKSFKDSFSHFNMENNRYFDILFSDSSYIMNYKMDMFDYIGCVLTYGTDSSTQTKCLDAVYNNNHYNSDREIFINCFINNYSNIDSKQYCNDEMSAGTYTYRVTNSKYSDDYAIYYDNSVAFYNSYNNEILFDSYKDFYLPISINPSSIDFFAKSWVTAQSIMGVNIAEDVSMTDKYQVHYTYVEPSSDLFDDYIIGSLPSADNEIVLPISYLFDLDILSDANLDSNYIKTNDIYELYLEAVKKDPSLAEVVIKQEVVGFGDTGTVDIIDDLLLADPSMGTKTYTITGFVNLRDTTNVITELDTTILEALGESIVAFPVIVSKTASENMNPIIAQYSDFASLVQSSLGDEETFNELVGSILFAPKYIEINSDTYEKLGLDKIISNFTTNYQNIVKDDVLSHFTNESGTGFVDILHAAHAEIVAYEQGTNTSLDINSYIDNTVFPGVTYKDLRNYMIVEYYSNSSKVDELSIVCSGCGIVFSEVSATNVEYLDSYADTIYNYISNPLNGQTEVIESFLNIERLSNRRAMNRIIYDEYGNTFTNLHFLSASAADNEENASLLQFYGQYPTLYIQAQNGLRGLVQSIVVVPLDLIADVIPYGLGSAFVGIIDAFDNSDFLQGILVTTNLDLLLNSMTYNPTKTFVINVLMLIVFAINLLFLAVLCLVVVNLFSNIFDTVAIRRRKEIGTLRILGTTFADVKKLIRIENLYSLIITGVVTFITILLIIYIPALNPFHLLGDVSIQHYYMPLLELYFDLNLTNIVNFNLVSITIAIIMYRYFVSKLILKRLSLSKVRDINSIESIKGDD